jgi:hypothetical protein
MDGDTQAGYFKVHVHAVSRSYRILAFVNAADACIIEQDKSGSSEMDHEKSR